MASTGVVHTQQLCENTRVEADEKEDNVHSVSPVNSHLLLDENVFAWVYLG